MVKIPDWLEVALCRTIGCTSVFAHRWEWPHRLVCTKIVNLDRSRNP